MDCVTHEKYSATEVLFYGLTDRRRNGEKILVEGMNFYLRPKTNIPGFGIYGLAYEENNGAKSLIYIGSFGGEENSGPFSGNIVTRWYKHVGSATGRLSTLGCDNKTQYKTHINDASGFYSKEKDIFRRSFLNIPDVSRERFYQRMGSQTSRNRMGFATQNLKSLHPMPLNLEDNQHAVLQRFTFLYWRVEKQFFKNDIRKSEILPGLRKCEKDAIIKCSKNLPLNYQYKKPRDLKSFYHYNQLATVKLGSPEFDELNADITHKLCLKAKSWRR